MPKRVIDGEAVWASDKISECSTKIPATSGVYYPWFYPLADANGILELTNIRVIHSKIGMNLPFLKIEHVEMILSDFRKHGLLFVWEVDGKMYGYWTGSEKSGRLPKPSDRAKYQNLDVVLPEEALVNRGPNIALTSPFPRPIRAKGIGLGVGIGVGLGIGREEEREPAPSAPLPSQHPIFLIWQEEHGPLPGAQGLSPDRLNKCRARMKARASDAERFLAEFRDAVRKATQNAFLTGSNDRGWKASFDWFIANDSNYLKVNEGKYEPVVEGGSSGGNQGHSRTSGAVAAIPGKYAGLG